MRACLLCLLLVLAGCVTTKKDGGSGDMTLSQADLDLAGALAHFSQGIILEEQLERHNSEALEHFEKASDLDPGRRRLHARIALAHLHHGRPGDAIATLARVCEQDPTSYQARVDLATACQLTGRTDLAIEKYQEAMELRPAAHFPYRAVSELQANQGRDKEALATLRQGFERATNAASLLRFAYRQATEMVRRGEMARAVPSFELVAEYATDPERTRLYHLLGELGENLGRPEEAARHYRQAIETPSTAPDSFLRLARLYAKKDPNKVIGVLNDAETHFPTNAVVHLRLGEYHEQRGDDEAAIRCYEKATVEDPPLPGAFIRLSIFYARTDTLKAAELLLRGAERIPSNPLILLQLAHLYGNEENFEKSIAVFDKISRLVDGSNEHKLTESFYLHYGAVCERAGLLDKAEAVFETCLASFPDTHEIMNYLAYMWSENNVKLERAMDYVTRALELEPGNGAYVDTMGWIYYKQKRYEQALKHLAEAYRIVKRDPVIADHIGDTLHALGRTETAISFWKESYRLDPDNENMMEKLRANGVDPEAVLREPATEPATLEPDEAASIPGSDASPESDDVKP